MRLVRAVGSAVLVASWAIGCGGVTERAPASPPPTPPTEPPSAATASEAEAPVAVASRGVGPTEPPSREPASCVSSRAPQEVPLHHPGDVALVGGRTFVYAWHRVGLEEPRTVLVSLDARGAVVETELAAGYAEPVTIASEPSGLLVLSVPSAGSPVAQHLRIAPDGTVTAEPARPIAELPRGWPVELASNGRVALVLHRVALPDGSAATMSLFVVDLLAARVVRADASQDVADVACVGRACAVARVGVDSASFAQIDDAGAEGQGTSVPFARQCRELERLESESGIAWLVRGATPAAVALRDAAPAVASPALATHDASSVPGEGGCGETLYPFDAAPWPGVTLGYRGAREVLAWDPEGGRFVAMGTLESDPWEQHEASAFVDGSIELAFTSASGMMHSPTDPDGRRRYFEHHSFEGGEIALWRREAGSWRRTDVRPLAVSDVEGSMSHGYAPRVLRNGAHAAALLLSEGLGEPGFVQPYREPCPSSRDSAGAR